MNWFRNQDLKSELEWGLEQINNFEIEIEIEIELEIELEIEFK